ncbi:RNA-guided endonuclease InsQ/TnpB family protein [Streptomyces sp. NPDC096311]|uniref:RNA-guided endonuclease InsQ/TnpB family protein n=1 Tax=Streptomyces sp. NPDC096311 TaxID=3366083 RepID=UPI0038148580
MTAHCFGACVQEEFGNIRRAVGNTGLEQRRGYRRRGAWVGSVRQARAVAEAKVEHSWPKAAPSHILQQTLRDVDTACRRHGTFRGRGKSKQRWQPSGWVTFRWSRSLGGAVKSATVTRDGKHWYVSFLVEDGVKAPAVSLERRRRGGDRGVVTPAATSDGQFLDRGFVSPGEAARYRRLQQRLARTRKGSERRRACRAKMRVIMRGVRDRRQDFHAQSARQMVDGNALVVLEDLNIAAMTATARGSVAEPGVRVRQKYGLNPAILDKGWHSFELAVRNRARRTGATVRTVNPARTSTTCPVRGHVHPDNRKSRARFVCTACGHEEHADTVGAKDTPARGHAGHRPWRPRRQPVREAPTSVKPQGINAPTA